MGTFFELGKDKAAKREGWAPPFISCAQDTVGLFPPLPIRLLGYGKPLPFWGVFHAEIHSQMTNVFSLFAKNVENKQVHLTHI